MQISFEIRPLLLYIVFFPEMASSVSSASAKGFQNASSYDKHRPSYPPEIVTRFLKHLQVHGVKGARVLDLAAGTGKFTELLVGRDEEPHDGR